MECLPPEMVCEVARHLNVTDLLACIAVSRRWREMFGSDEIWRPRCDEDSEEYLKTTPCRVEPKFQSPQTEDSTLSPIGRWRTAHIRERHLLKNWIKGNFVEDLMNKSYLTVVFLNNDFVITISEDGSIRLINTIADPSVCAVLEVTTRDDTETDSWEIHTIGNDKFILWDGSTDTVVIIRVEWKPYALTVEKSFCLYNGDCLSVFAIIKNKLVIVGSGKLHIWDLGNCLKLKTVSPDPESDESSLRDEKCSIYNEYVMDHDVNNENLGILCSMSNRECFFVYSLKHFDFLPFKIQQTDEIRNFVLGEKYVTLSFVKTKTVRVYDYHTSQCVYSLESYGLQVWPMGNNVVINVRPNKLMRLTSKGDLECLRTNAIFSKISDIMCWSRTMCIAPIGDEDDQDCGNTVFKLLTSHTSSVSIVNFSSMYGTSDGNRACSKINQYRSGGNTSDGYYYCLRFYW